MSNIIKGGRISSQSIIDLSKRIEEQEIEQVTLDLNPQQEELNMLYAKAVQEKKKIIDEAKQEAMLLLAKAKAEAMQELEHAKEKAKDILAKSNQEAKNYIEKAREEATEIHNDAFFEKENIIKQAEPEVVDTIVTLVSHIVHESIIHDTKWVQLLVKKILLQEELADPVILRVSPILYEKITQQQKEELGALEVTLYPKQDLEQTAIIVETSHGNIEYNVEEGLEQTIRQVKMFQEVGVANGYN